MAYKTQPPTVTRKAGHSDGGMQTFNHPAFGKITVTKPCGGGTELFGSALQHRSYVCVKIESAYLNRELNTDWIHGEKTVVEIMLSEAQWSHFVSSQGDGSGTPITFRYKPEDGYRLMDVPGIESIETMKQTFSREVEEDCRKALAQANDLVAELKALVAAGKANKGQLTSALNRLENFTTNLPSHIGFIQEQFAESMEKTVEAGKTEVESFINNLAHRTGLEVLRNQSVAMIEVKDGDSITMSTPNKGESK